MRPRIIGILGQSGSGKDTVADYLVHRYGYVKVALADPLKRICKDVYNFTDEQLWGPSASRNKVDERYGKLSPRVALQTLGTEWGRNCYDGTWIEYGMRVADKILDGNGYTQKRGLYMKGYFERLTKKVSGVVIPDIRFKNEVQLIRNRLTGFVVRLYRPDADGHVGLANHASEVEQKAIPDEACDAIVYNRESLDKLYDRIDSMMLDLPSMRPVMSSTYQRSMQDRTYGAEGGYK